MSSVIDKLIAAGMVMVALPAQCGEPVVQGPEAVQDWYEAGQRFIRDAEQLEIRARKAKNVILFVGDGMGISTLTAARILEGQLKGRTGEENRLSFEDFPYAALSKTYTWDQQTPDSAPTMTAMIIGYKAREGMLSVDHQTPRGECNAGVIAAHTLPTLLEQAAAAGKATGVVSTARLTHATPAATYAHTPMRDWESDTDLPAGCGVKDIARQLIEVSPAVRGGLRVAMGGGRTNFMPAVRNDPESVRKGKRQDGRDLVAEWQQTRGPGSRYVWNRAGFDAIDPAATTHLLGLFESSHMQYELDRAKDQGGEPSLTEMTDKAIRLLQKEKNGFFLHVEAGRMDHAHHAGNAKRALVEVIELARAVRGEDVAIFATGPMAHLIHGSMEQNWIYHVMRRAFGF